MPGLPTVLPAHTEEENVEPLISELSAVLSELRREGDVVCVFADDGSGDRTREKMLAAREAYQELSIRIEALELWCTEAAGA